MMCNANIRVCLRRFHDSKFTYQDFLFSDPQLLRSNLRFLRSWLWMLHSWKIHATLVEPCFHYKKKNFPHISNLTLDWGLFILKLPPEKQGLAALEFPDVLLLRKLPPVTPWRIPLPPYDMVLDAVCLPLRWIRDWPGRLKQPLRRIRREFPTAGRDCLARVSRCAE